MRRLKIGRLAIVLGVLVTSTWMIAPASATHANRAGTYFDYLVTILMENEGYHQIIGQTCCPYQTGLANNFSLATQYFGVLHPSLPEYLALSGGSTFEVTTNCLPTSNPCNIGASCCPISDLSIFDLLGPVTFKAYAEDYPVPIGCFTGSGSSNGLFLGRHFPWNYFSDITGNSTRCMELVKANTATTSRGPETPDIMLNDLSSFRTASNMIWLTPNECDNSHNSCFGTNQQAESDQYLSTLVPSILNSFVFRHARAALLITYDEAFSSDYSSDQVPAIFAGLQVKRGFQSSIPHNHYSWLRTIETNWGLPCLVAENDCSATPMSEFFNVPANCLPPGLQPTSEDPNQNLGAPNGLIDRLIPGLDVPRGPQSQFWHRCLMSELPSNMNADSDRSSS